MRPSASQHDSQKLDDVLDPTNASKEVSAAQRPFRSAKIEQRLKEKGCRSRVHQHAARNERLSQTQEAANTVRWKVRARIEHVFGHRRTRSAARLTAHHRHGAGEVARSG